MEEINSNTDKNTPKLTKSGKPKKVLSEETKAKKREQVKVAREKRLEKLKKDKEEKNKPITYADILKAGEMDPSDDEEEVDNIVPIETPTQLAESGKSRKQKPKKAKDEVTVDENIVEIKPKEDVKPVKVKTLQDIMWEKYNGY